MPRWALTVLVLAGAMPPALTAEPSAAPAGYVFGSPRDGKGFAVWLVSPRAGLLFTDSEPVDVRVRVTGAAAATAVECEAKETEGPWQAKETLSFDPGETEKALRIKWPGRGLFQLTLSAKSGARSARAEARLGIVFAPSPPDPKSPWGIFFAPHIWYDKDLPRAPEALAQSHRLLGASWSRLNFWAQSFGKVTVVKGGSPSVTSDYVGGLWKDYAKALRREGISILGEIAQCPRELSSRPEESKTHGDAGALCNRVKPADYALWERFVEQLAADFREEIEVWEIWNEPNLKDNYWVGSPEEFAELIGRTAPALRRGNPKARVAVSGFTGGHDFADKVLGLGAARHTDILSVHYTDERAGDIGGWHQLLKKHGLKAPIWNSEEKTEVPLRNLMGGIERSFKFIHVNIGYPDYRPLVEKDLTPRPSAIWFSVGAHCIGTAQPAPPPRPIPSGGEAFYFRRGEETIGVFDFERLAAPRLFATARPELALQVEPLAAGTPVTATDRWGRSRELVVENGRTRLAVTDRTVFVNGARKLQVDAAAPGPAAVPEDVLVFEAEDGAASPGWAKAAHEGFSGGRTLDIYSEAEPGAGGHWVELKVRVPADGRYEVLFSGNSLARLKAPRSLSTFVWSLGGSERRADGPLEVREKVPGAPEGLSVLGTAELKRGEHVFRLKLTGRREQPDKHYALWFDALALKRQ